jgi:transcriptional regulator with GAF, ATPase, and Fis domain
LDVRETFESVSAVVKPVLPHDHLVLFSSSPDEKTINLEAYSGDSTRGLPASAPVREYRWLPTGNESQVVEDVAALAPRGQTEPMVKVLGIRAALRIPIYLEGEPESTLNFWSRSPGAYSQEDIPVARRVADLVSLALSHKRLSEQERRAAVLEQRVESLTRELETTLGIRKVVGTSKKWKDILGHVARVAPTETTVLLTGESGTGKEVLARMIHAESPRARGPFVAVNCAALPENLLESELFGHERGAFTGATTTRSGRIEQAAGGVLFLDEIGEMSPVVQAKVLRVLEQREFMKVGGSRLQKADIRLIAATNRDLQESMARGDFREDLYYRLRVFEITAPPLRERGGDILLLAEAFLGEIGVVVGRPATGLSKQAREALMGYRWPGNVRELRNVLERATILCDGGPIDLEHLPPEVSPKSPPDRGSESSSPTCLNLKQVESDFLQKALLEAKGNRAKAAKLLGISRPTLYYRLRKQGLL